MDFELSPGQRQLQARARALAETHIAPRAEEIDRTEAYPWDHVERLRTGGFLGMTMPKSLGGQGLGYFEAVLVIEEMAKHCSAATQMKTRADKRGGVYVLNGGKHWITGGGVSRLHLIFARVFDERGAEQGIGGFIAVRDPKTGAPKGLIVGKREPAMGLRGIPEAELIFENLEIPADMLLVPPRGLGHGFGELMDAYNGQRIGAATVALGLAQGAFEKAVAYANRREQFGRPIAEFQGLQWMLADMSIALEAARALIWKAAASAPPGGFPDAAIAARAKILAAETAIKVTNDALQIWGGAGYSRDNPMERYVRDARMFAIAGGTTQVLRTLVASTILGRKLPQTRDGYVRMSGGTTAPSTRGKAKERSAVPAG